MGQHTPGPWAVDGEDIFAKVLSPDGWVIAETDHVHVGRPDEWEDVHMANMRLIAAAPDLLAALIQQCPCECQRGSMTDDFGNEREIVDVCQRCAAIAKAEGK